MPGAVGARPAPSPVFGFREAEAEARAVCQTTVPWGTCSVPARSPSPRSRSAVLSGWGPSSCVPWPPPGEPGLRRGGGSRGDSPSLCVRLWQREVCGIWSPAGREGPGGESPSPRTAGSGIYGRGRAPTGKSQNKNTESPAGPGGTLPKACPQSRGGCPCPRQGMPRTTGPWVLGPGAQPLSGCPPADNEMGFARYTVVLWA